MSATIDQLPPEVRGALDAELGEPERIYGSTAPRLMRGVRGGLIVAAVFVMIAALLPIFTPVWAIIFPLVVAGWAGLSTIPKAIRASQTRTELIVLCPNGFVQLDAEDQVLIFRFDKIVSVRQNIRDIYYNGARAGTEHTFTVTTQKRNTAVLDDRFEDITDLGDQVSRRVAERLLQAAVAALGEGRSVTVRPFRISTRGITADSRQLDWARIAEARFAAGRFQVTEVGRHKPWVSIPVSEIDNIYLLLTLVESLREASQAG